MSTLGEDLHTGTFVAAIAYNEFAIVVHNSNLAWIPELTLLLASDTKLKLECTHFIKDFDSMIICIGDNDLLIDSKAKAMG